MKSPLFQLGMSPLPQRICLTEIMLGQLEDLPTLVAAVTDAYPEPLARWDLSSRACGQCSEARLEAFQAMPALLVAEVKLGCIVTIVCSSATIIGGMMSGADA